MSHPAHSRGAPAAPSSMSGYGLPQSRPTTHSGGQYRLLQSQTNVSSQHMLPSSQFSSHSSHLPPLQSPLPIRSPSPYHASQSFQESQLFEEAQGFEESQPPSTYYSATQTHVQPPLQREMAATPVSQREMRELSLAPRDTLIPPTQTQAPTQTQRRDSIRPRAVTDKYRQSMQPPSRMSSMGGHGVAPPTQPKPVPASERVLAATSQLESRVLENTEQMRQMRDLLHDVRTSMHALPTREEMKEAVLETLSPAMHEFFATLTAEMRKVVEAVPDKTTQLTLDKTRLLLDNVALNVTNSVHTAAQTQVQHHSMSDKPIMALLEHLIHCLAPVDELKSAILSISDLPEALQSVAVFHRSMEMLHDKVDKAQQPTPPNLLQSDKSAGSQRPTTESVPETAPQPPAPPAATAEQVDRLLAAIGRMEDRFTTVEERLNTSLVPPTPPPPPPPPPPPAPARPPAPEPVKLSDEAIAMIKTFHDDMEYFRANKEEMSATSLLRALATAASEARRDTQHKDLLASMGGLHRLVSESLQEKSTASNSRSSNTSSNSDPTTPPEQRSRNGTPRLPSSATVVSSAIREASDTPDAEGTPAPAVETPDIAAPAAAAARKPLRTYKRKPAQPKTKPAPKTKPKAPARVPTTRKTKQPPSPGPAPSDVFGPVEGVQARPNKKRKANTDDPLPVEVAAETPPAIGRIGFGVSAARTSLRDTSLEDSLTSLPSDKDTSGPNFSTPPPQAQPTQAPSPRRSPRLQTRLRRLTVVTNTLLLPVETKPEVPTEPVPPLPAGTKPEVLTEAATNEPEGDGDVAMEEEYEELNGDILIGLESP